MRSDKIVLVGMMGSGKSTLGRLTAQQLGYAFFDADIVIEDAAGMSAREIFRRHGEAEFRRRELETLKTLLTDPLPALIAAGGGAFCQEEVRRHLRGVARTVFIRVAEEELARRLAAEGVATRPMLAGDWKKRVAELVQLRYPLYETADVIFDVGIEPPAETAERLAALLRRPSAENGERIC